VAAKRKRSQKIDSDKSLKARSSGLFLFSNHEKKFHCLVCLALILFTSCKKEKDSDKLTPTCDGSSPTYQSTIKSIIDSKCATPNCHSTFSDYSGLQPILQDGSFRREVLVDQTMPEGSSLSQDQLNKIQCWVNNGFPEN